MSSKAIEPKVISKGTPKVVVRRARNTNHIPDSVLKDEKLRKAIEVLPANYNFEIYKTVHRIRQLSEELSRPVQVALQLPEGLLIFALPIVDILEEFCDCMTVVFGDVTYGACCIDDLGAKALSLDLLIHYGHSCLIPMDRGDSLKVLYIFVDILIDMHHLKETIKTHFGPSTRVGLLSTIQFVATIQSIAEQLNAEGYHLVAPQTKPLSPGETLGCTSPRFDADAILYVGDGRFHLEAAMIANHGMKAYKYDPYDKCLTEEKYDYERMLQVRSDCVQRAHAAKTFGVILGTLGRQGSMKVFDNLEEDLVAAGKTVLRVLLSEIFPQKLALMRHVDAWVQIACPRLSIDWGLAFQTPLLTPYELSVVLRRSEWKNDYPMDFYSTDSLGPWTPNHKPPKTACGDCDCKKK